MRIIVLSELLDGLIAYRRKRDMGRRVYHQRRTESQQASDVTQRQPAPCPCTACLMCCVLYGIINSLQYCTHGRLHACVRACVRAHAQACAVVAELLSARLVVGLLHRADMVTRNSPWLQPDNNPAPLLPLTLTPHVAAAAK